MKLHRLGTCYLISKTKDHLKQLLKVPASILRSTWARLGERSFLLRGAHIPPFDNGDMPGRIDTGDMEDGISQTSNHNRIYLQLDMQSGNCSSKNSPSKSISCVRVFNRCRGTLSSGHQRATYSPFIEKAYRLFKKIC